MSSNIQIRAAKAENYFKAGKYAEAVDLIKSMREDSDPDLYLLLGKVYRNGWGVLRDKRAALEIFQKACEFDEAAAYREMARVYSSKVYLLDGKNTLCKDDYDSWNKVKALTYKAVQAGDVSALSDLLEMYFEAGVDRKDPVRRKDAEAAAEKLADAIFTMPDQEQLQCCRPLIRFCGRVDDPHFSRMEKEIRGKILNMLREHGLRGDEWALDALTHVDNILAINKYEAHAWIIYAAGMGFSKAEAKLAKLSIHSDAALSCEPVVSRAPVSAFLAMIDGEGGLGDVIERYGDDTLLIWSWLVYAADNRNDADAAFRLGLMLMNGYGVPKDPLLARSMFLSAAHASYPPANSELAYLEKILYSAENPEKYRDYAPLHKTLEDTVKDWPTDEKREISGDLDLLLKLIRQAFADNMRTLISCCLDALDKNEYKTAYTAPVLENPETGFMAKKRNQKRLEEMEKLERQRVDEAVSAFAAVRPLYEKLQQALSDRAEALGREGSALYAQLSDNERSLEGLLRLFQAGFGYGLCSLNDIRIQAERMDSLPRIERSCDISDMNLYQDAAAEWVKELESFLSEQSLRTYDYSVGLARCSGPLFEQICRNKKLIPQNKVRLYFSHYYYYAECGDPDALYVLAGMSDQFPEKSTRLAALAMGSQLQIDAIYHDFSQRELLGLTSDQFDFYRSRVSNSVRMKDELDRLKREVYIMNIVQEEQTREIEHRRAMAEAQAEKEALDRYRKNTINPFTVQNYVDQNERLFNQLMNGAYETNEERYQGGHRDLAQNLTDQMVRAAKIEEAKWKLDPNIL